MGSTIRNGGGWFRLDFCMASPARGEANALRNGGAGTSVHVPKNTTLLRGGRGHAVGLYVLLHLSRGVTRLLRSALIRRLNFVVG